MSKQFKYNYQNPPSSRGGIAVPSICDIREALCRASDSGYTLFPEINDASKVSAAFKNPATKNLLEPFLAYGEESLLNPVEPQMCFTDFIEFSKSGNRSRYEKPWFRSKAQINAVVLRELFLPNEENIRFLENRLWSWCDRYTWEFPAHVPLTTEQIDALGYEADEVIGLFSAETGFYFAEILSLIGEKINPLLRYRMESEIERRIFSAYEKHDFHWEEQRMNWSAVCAGSVGCAAIYLIKQDYRLARIIHRLIGAFSSYFEGYYQDGLTPEGVGYWGYGFGFFLYFAQMLCERTNGAIDLIKDNPLIEKVAMFPAALQLSGGGTVNFSDSSYTAKWEANLAMSSLLSRRFGRPLYAQVGCGIDVMGDGAAKWAHIARGLFWAPSGDKASGKNLAPITHGLYNFKEAQWLIDKRRTDGAELAFAVKGGHNDEPHNHNDLGHFVLHRDGVMLFCDLGAPDYSRQYFRAETRYGFINASSLGHSVPVIDGCEQSAGAEYRSSVTELTQEDGITNLTIDLTKAYNCPGLTEYLRTFVWNYQNRQLSIRDSFSFSGQGSHQVDCVFVTRMQQQHDMPNEKIMLADGITQLNYPAGADCKIEEGSFIANGSLSKESFYRSVITLKTQQQQLCAEFLITL